MIEGPEIEKHRHKTGHSHVDLILGSLAVLMSMVSIFIAVHHGQTMEKLVEANSWPNISFGNSNEMAGAPRTIALAVRNTGVGPARIDTFEVFYEDKPVRNFPQLLKLCCDATSQYFSTSLVRDEVLPAREEIDFATFGAGPNKPDVWEALNQKRMGVRVRVCYCSVFDECWVKDSRVARPDPVKQCVPSQPIEYGL